MKAAWIFTIVILAVAAPAGAQTLDSLDAALTKIDQQRESVRREYDREKNMNDQRQRRIDGGEASGNDVQEAYASAARLEQMNARLNDLDSQKEALCGQWRALYRTDVDSMLAAAEKESDRKKKAEAGRRLQQLQARNAQLCAESSPKDPLQWQALHIEPYDGPQEIAQKTQLLKDIEREMILRVSRLDDAYRQAQKERRTRERAQEFVQEGTLFDESLTARAPGNNPVNTAVTNINGGSAAEVKTSTPEALSPVDAGGEWQFGDNPKKAEEDYMAKRGALLQQQKELKKKIHEFEEIASNLLHP